MRPEVQRAKSRGWATRTALGVLVALSVFLGAIGHALWSERMTAATLSRVPVKTCPAGQAMFATDLGWECRFDGDITSIAGATGITASWPVTNSNLMTTEARYIDLADLADSRPQCRRTVRNNSKIVGTYLMSCDDMMGDLTIIGFEPAP